MIALIRGVLRQTRPGLRQVVGEGIARQRAVYPIVDAGVPGQHQRQAVLEGRRERLGTREPKPIGQIVKGRGDELIAADRRAAVPSIEQLLLERADLPRVRVDRSTSF